MHILQMNILAALLILAVAILRTAAVNKLPKRIFLALWSIVLLRLVVPFSLPSPFSVYSADESNLPAHRLAAALGDTIAPLMTQQLNGADKAEEVSSGILPTPMWLIIWCIGTVFCAAIFAISYWRCRMEFQTSIPVRESYAKQWVESHPLKRPISIRQLDKISAPLTYGIFHPVILVPKKTDWKNAEMLEYVLLHEYVHICRFDTLTKLILTFVLCFYWYNPFVWLMYVLFHRDMELACDESVIRRLGEHSKSTYARILISMEEKKIGFTPIYSSFSKNATEERIIAIMKTRKISFVTAFIGVVLIAAMTTACAVSAPNTQVQPDYGTQIKSEKGSIAEDINVPDSVRQAAMSVAVQAMEKGQYKDWRIGALAHVYTYENLEGKIFEVYQMDYECMTENPQPDTMAGGMTADKNGWLRPEYANSNFLIFARKGENLSYAADLVENDCSPGDKLFTSDLKEVLQKNKMI